MPVHIRSNIQHESWIQCGTKKLYINVTKCLLFKIEIRYREKIIKFNEISIAMIEAPKP